MTHDGRGRRLGWVVLAAVGLCGRGAWAEVATPPAVPSPASALQADAEPADGAGEGAAGGKQREVQGDNGNPYRAIVARNAFRLKEPVPPPPPPTNAPPPPEATKVDVKLVGVATIKGVRYAYLMVPDSERPGQFLYPTLTDNAEHGRVRLGNGLEVLEINCKNARKPTVRIVNGGVETTLNFQDHGLKGAAAPTPAAPGGKPGAMPMPGAPGMNNVPRPGNASTTVFPAGGGVIPQPVDNKAANSEPVVFSRNANRASANQNLNSGSSGNAYIPLVGNSAGGSGVVPTTGVSSGGVLPARNVRTDTATAVPNIPVEHQYEVLIRQRQAAESIGVRLPPIPGMPVEAAPVPTP